MTEIVFAKDIEPRVQAEIEKHLKPFLWLVPTWCHKLFIGLRLSTPDDRAAIRTSVTYEYRFANMEIYSSWLALSDDEQQLHVIHDLLHTSNCAYVDFAEEAFRNLTPGDGDAKLRGYLMEQSRVHLEGMTQDLARAIQLQLQFRPGQ